MKEKHRDPYVDILKAIGIISIVIGHSSWILPGTQFPIGPFVYTYHIMIFLFVGGFTFKREAAELPYIYIGMRLKSLAGLFVKYSILVVILHNILREFHIIGTDQVVYDFSSILENIVYAFTLVSTETMLSAFWFIPMYFFAMSLFCIMFHYAEVSRYPKATHCIFILITAVVGVYVNEKEMYFNYHIQTSILGIPVIYLGYVVKRYWAFLRYYIKVGLGIGCAFLIYGIIDLNIGGGIELSVNAIMHPLLFYPVTGIGIYFCLSLAKILNSQVALQRLFSFIGKNSFHIMALHFLCFKIVDVVYGSWIHADISLLESFPHAFDFSLIYYLYGTFLSLIHI